MGYKDWDPRGMYPRIEQLEKFASSVIGDGKRPDLFFVTVEGNVVLISQSFTIAYAVWKRFSYPMKRETSLENRTYGVLASVEPEDEGSSKLVRMDDTAVYQASAEREAWEGRG